MTNVPFLNSQSEVWWQWMFLTDGNRKSKLNFLSAGLTAVRSLGLFGFYIFKWNVWNGSANVKFTSCWRYNSFVFIWRYFRFIFPIFTILCVVVFLFLVRLHFESISAKAWPALTFTAVFAVTAPRQSHTSSTSWKPPNSQHPAPSPPHGTLQCVLSKGGRSSDSLWCMLFSTNCSFVTAWRVMVNFLLFDTFHGLNAAGVFTHINQSNKQQTSELLILLLWNVRSGV